MAWYPADGNGNDIVGGFNGTLTNGVEFAPGEVGAAFSFNGTNQYVHVNGSQSVSGARTITAWIYPSPNTGLGLPIIVGGVTGAGDFFGVAGTAGNCNIGQNELYIDHWGTPCYDSNLVVTPNSWNFVAVTYDGSSTITFYLNGVASAPISGQFYDYGINTYDIGGNNIFGTTTKPAFNGLIDELDVYSRALTAAEIQSIFNAGAAGKCKPPAILSPLQVTGTAGRLFTYQIVANTQPTSYSATALPAGLSLDPRSGIISGVPASAGTTTVQVTAGHAGGPVAQASLIITVNPTPTSGPTISSGTSITARTGQRFSFQVLASATTPQAAANTTGLPPGLSIDRSSGLISGTPTVDGHYDVTVTVTDGSFSPTASLQITVLSDPAVPVITSPGAVFLPKNQPFSYTITAPSSAPDKPTYAYLGTLPAGLSFDPVTGTISGTRTTREERISGATYMKALNDTPVVAGGGLVATNSGGTGTKPIVFFEPANDPLLNISTRLPVLGGDNVLIGGFIVTGQDSKKIIARGIGPSLASSGLSGVLADPTLELHTGSTLLASNDNWQDTQKDDIQATTVPPSNPLEPAIVSTLAPAPYTAVVQGKNGGTGVGLVEVYDLSPAAASKLANISTRGFVDVNDKVMIAGFIIGSGGAAPAHIIVRGLGPSLAAQGVSGALADPTLELHDSNGTTLSSNDNWKDAPNASDIQATGIPPTNDAESAILQSLGPGAYTAILRGKSNSTGVGLVEVYALQ